MQRPRKRGAFYKFREAVNLREPGRACGAHTHGSQLGTSPALHLRNGDGGHPSIPTLRL